MSYREAHPPARIDFWELFAGQAGLTPADKESNLSVAPPLDCFYPAFGRIWNLASGLDQELFWCLYDVLRPLAIHAGLPCEHYSVMGERKPDQEDQSIRVLVCRVLKRQDKEKKKGIAESPTSSLLWQEPDWVHEFGQLSSPVFPWQYMSTDGCQYGMESKNLSDDTYGQPIKKAQVWLGNFCMSEFSLRRGRPDALAFLEHSHRHVKGTIKVEVAEGKTKWMGVGKLSGVYEPACCHAYMTCLKRALQQAEGRTVSGGVPPRERTSGPPVTDPKGVVTSDSLSPAEREKLDKVSPLYHGTDADRVESIIKFGLLAGGGNERNRLAVHWILARPVGIAEVPGFRSGSTVLIETSIRHLVDSGVGVYHGSDGVILTESVSPEGLLRAWLYNDGQYSNLVADFDVDENANKLLPDPEAPQANDDDVGVLEVLPDGDTNATTEEDEEEEKVEVSGSKAAGSVKPKASEPSSSSGIKRDAAGRAVEEAPAVVRDAEPEASSRVVSMEEGPAGSGADPKDEGVAIAEGSQEAPKQETPAVVTDAVGSGEAAKILGSGVKRTIQKKKATQAARAKAKSGSYRISPKAKAKAKAKAMAISEEDRGYKVTGRALKLSSTVIQLAESYAARVACSKRQLNLAAKELIAVRKLKNSIGAEEVRRVLGQDQECSSCDGRHKKLQPGLAKYLKERKVKGQAVSPAGQLLASRFLKNAATKRRGQSEEPGEKKERKKKRRRRGITLRSVARTDFVVLKTASYVQREETKKAQEAAERALEKEVKPIAKARAAPHEWGSWGYVNQDCRNGNGPGVNECPPCKSLFRDSVEWASDLDRKIKRREKQREQVRVLARALSEACWTCSRCNEENLISRWKCYRCSKPRPSRMETHGEESSDDEERDKAIMKTLKDLPASRKRKRGGVKHKKKKVCRYGRTHHFQRKHSTRRAGNRAFFLWLQRKMEEKVSRGYFVPRTTRNRVAHAPNGNTHVLLKALAVATIIPLAWRAEQEGEMVLESISAMTIRVIEEVEGGTVTAVQTATRVVASAVLAVGAVILWYLGSAMANRLAHIVHGNVSMPTKLIEMKGNKTTWEVTGSRGKHAVWLKIGSPRQSACACKGYINSGTCGHIQCAVEQAKIMNLIEKRAIEFDEVSIATAKGAAVLRSMGKHDAPRSPLCFGGVLRKAQEKLSKAGSLEKVTQGSKSCFEGLVKKKPPQPAILDAPGGSSSTVMNNAVEVKSNRAVVSDTGDAKEIHFLKDGETFEWTIKKLAGVKQGGRILIRAYSFDQPAVVASLIGAIEKGGQAKLITDRSQAAGKTKQQLQVLKQLRNTGAPSQIDRWS